MTLSVEQLGSREAPVVHHTARLPIVSNGSDWEEGWSDGITSSMIVFRIRNAWSS